MCKHPSHLGMESKTTRGLIVSYTDCVGEASRTMSAPCNTKQRGQRGRQSGVKSRVEKSEEKASVGEVMPCNLIVCKPLKSTLCHLSCTLP